MAEPAGWIHGRYWYFVDNLRVRPGEKAEVLLWAALPMDRPGQRAEVGKFSPEPADVLEDAENGNRIVHWRAAVGEGASRIRFFYDFRFLAEPVLTGLDPDAVREPPAGGPEVARFTRSEPWIELTPEIRAKAAEIAGAERNPARRARRIFDWVVSRMRYEYPDVANRGAAKSFRALKGDCGEYSVVFAALCRSAGIPARTVTCCWLTGSGHQWAEVFLPPYGWVPADTSAAAMVAPGSGFPMPEKDILDFMKAKGIPSRDPAWLFGNLYPNRLVVFVGCNVETASAKGGARTFGFLQPGGANAEPPGIELRGLEPGAVHAGFYVFGERAEDPAFAEEKAEKELASPYFAAGLHDKAGPALAKRVAENPADAAAWLDLGQVRMGKGEFVGAIEAFRAAIAGRGGSLKPVIEAWARNLLGACLDLQGNRAEAVKEYEAVLASGVTLKGADGFARRFLGEPFPGSSGVGPR